MTSGIYKKDQLLRILQYSFFTLVILYFGRSLFIPLSFALLISFILYPICAWLEKHKFSKPLAIFVCLTLFSLLIAALLGLLAYQFNEFLKEWPVLSVKLTKLIKSLDLWIANSNLSNFIDTERGFINSVAQYVIDYTLPILPEFIAELRR